MKKILYLFLILLFFSSSLFAQIDEHVLLPSGHWVYDALEVLSLETGEVSFVTSAPVSVSELKRFFADLKTDELSNAGSVLYNKVLNFFANDRSFKFSSDVISVSVQPIIQPEFFFKTDDDVDWEHDFYERGKFLLLPLRVSVKDILTVESVMYLGQNYGTSLLDNRYTNIPISADDIDINFPKRAYISTGLKSKNGSFFSFQLGRDNLSVGRTLENSIIMSDECNPFGYARMAFFSPQIKYSLTVSEYEVDKYLYFHTLAFRPVKRFSISLHEGIMVNSAFELRYLNPGMIYHGFAAWRDYGTSDSNIGSFFCLSADVNPWKYFRLYGIFAMNQFQTEYEVENFSSAAIIPNSISCQVGVESFVPMKSGFWQISAECTYTSPWMYILKRSGWSFYQLWSESIGPDTDDPIYSWIGSPYGPDCISGIFKTGYKSSGNWDLFFVYKIIALGDNGKNFFNSLSDDDDDYYPDTKEEATIQSPSGNATYTNIFSIEGTYYFKTGVELKGSFAYKNVKNNEEVNHCVEISTSCKINLCGVVCE